MTPTVHFNVIVAHNPEPAHIDVRGSDQKIKLGVPGQGFHGPKTTGQVEKLFDQLDMCDKQITPHCLRALYGLVYNPRKAKDNSYGIGEYLSNIVRPPRPSLTK